MNEIISEDLYENMQYFHEKLQVAKNFDIIYRMLSVGGRDACLYFV